MEDINRILERLVVSAVDTRKGNIKVSHHSEKLKTGTTVGHNAQPISESNLGFQLLRSMGWSGGGLGSHGNVGIEKPIDVVIKNNKQGLGFDRK